MASPPQPATTPTLDAQRLTIGVIATRWNQNIVDRLRAGAQRAVRATGASHLEVTVPGAFELPFAAKTLIESAAVDAVVVLGVVIRGETTHYELVSDGCAPASWTSNYPPAHQSAWEYSPSRTKPKHSPAAKPTVVTTWARKQHWSRSKWPSSPKNCERRQGSSNTGIDKNHRVSEPRPQRRIA